MHSTDIVAYTYNADIYCPGCIAQMFTEPDTGDGVNAVQAQWMSTEDILGRVAEQRGIDYSDPHSYDSDEFPKPLFLNNVNDAEFDHCGNMNDTKFKEVCEQHIAHDEYGSTGCYRWRNIDVRGPDFQGHDIYWSDLDGYGFTLEMHQIFRFDESEGRTRYPGSSDRIRWRYTFRDDKWVSADHYPDPEPPVFEGEDFESHTSADEPAVVASLLGFLSLQDGDTDSDYFDTYTPRQLAWRDERAETLSLVQYDQFEGE